MSGWFSAQLWADMFRLGLPVIEKVLRPCLVYLFLVVGLRVFGKRELAQTNTFDLIVLLTLSNTVQNAIIGDDNSVTGGVIGAISLLALNYLVVRFLFRRAKLDRFLEGAPVPLIEHGQVLQQNLDSELITLAELEAAAHKQGYSRLDDVDQCVLETGGSLAFIAKDPSPMQTHYDDLVRRLDTIDQQLRSLQAARSEQ
ncbi:MAG TPA: YetF domain-containing protein [Roseiflexaceae bacterium]|nr:YetF domain-containing protein [Roseiflexaceae bacterium]